MGYGHKCKVRILVGKHEGRVANAEKAKNMNTEVWDHDPEPIYVTDTEDEYLYAPHEVEEVD